MYDVCQVETIGDAYMVVAGAPERQANHGEMVCNMALDMVEAITELTDPSTGEYQLPPCSTGNLHEVQNFLCN